MFQISESEDTVFDAISYYKAFKKYLMFLGQFPTQSQWSRKLNVTLSTCSIISLLFPAFSQFFASIVARNLDDTLECVPVIVTALVSVIKLVNHEINKERFDKLFYIMKEEWFLSDKDNARILNKISRQGNMLAKLYRNTILICMIIVLFLPLHPLILDFILPLNESRQQQQLFKLKYFGNEDEHFHTIYMHSAWSSFVIVIVIITMDSLYMMVVHHSCALFSICGYQVMKATEPTNVGINGTSIQELKKCIVLHKKAIKFFEIMDESTRLSYFFQILCNMIGITVTSVQTFMYLHKPDEAFRIAVFLMGQQFHLLIMTLPGQVLQDHCLDLYNNIYSSKWYQMPLDVQKLIYTMLMRSSKVCKLTAGGLYEMNIENFGITFKACMSYFTMLVSLQE